MAALLSPAALLVAGGAPAAGAADSPRRTSSSSPTARKSAADPSVPPDPVVPLGGPGGGAVAVGADTSDPSGSGANRRDIKKNESFPSMDDLLSRLPDVLFTFEAGLGDVLLPAMSSTTLQTRFS